MCSGRELSVYIGRRKGLAVGEQLTLVIGCGITEYYIARLGSGQSDSILCVFFAFTPELVRLLDCFVQQAGRTVGQADPAHFQRGFAIAISGWSSVCIRTLPYTMRD